MEVTYLDAAWQLAGILFGGCATVTVALLLGRTVLGQSRSLRGKLTESEGWLLSFALGAAILSSLVFGLCATGLFYDASVWTVGIGVALAWRRWGRWNWEPQLGKFAPEGRSWQLLLGVPAVIYGALYALHTLSPEVAFDATGYHLGMVQRYYRNHGFVAIPTNLYAQLSQGAEMLYLFAYSLGRESAAKLVHFSFLVAGAGSLIALAGRYRAGFAGVFAAVIYFTCPVVIPDAASGYNDCALAFFLLSVFSALGIWWHLRDRHSLWLLGVLIGACFAIKYTGVVSLAAAVAVAASIALRTRSPRAVIRDVAVIGVFAAIIGLPWLAKNAIVVGNPLAPFYNDWFPNPYLSVEFETSYREAMRTYSPEAQGRFDQLLSAPLDLVHGERYQGSIGWLFLLAPVSLLAWRNPLARATLAAAVVCALPWLSNAGARFLLPSLPFVAFSMGLALERLPNRTRTACVTVLLIAQCITSWPPFRAYWYYEHLWTVVGFPWRAALGLEHPKQHLSWRLSYFLLADHLDKMDPHSVRVLTFCEVPDAYCGVELLVPYKGLENLDLADALMKPLDVNRRIARTLRTVQPGRHLRGIRLEIDRAHARRSLIVSEIRLFSNGRIMPYDGNWDVSAQPHPWHALRLLDGDPFTTWNSREPATPGMSIEARFQEPRQVDALEVVHPLDSALSDSKLVIRGLSDSGAWSLIGLESTEIRQVVASADSGRQSALRMLKRHGITHLVLNLDPDFEHADEMQAIASDPAAWGLRKTFELRTATLYEVDSRPNR